MAFVRIRFSADDVVERRRMLLENLGRYEARLVLVRALNHTGRKSLTAVRRGLVQQTSAPRRAVVNAVTARAATTRGSLQMSFIISARGGALPLRLFRHRQNASGVVARVWGRSKTYRSAFIVQSLQGDVFKRKGEERTPLRMQYGPNMATELVKDDSRAAFQRIFLDLPGRLDHELQRVLR